MCLIEIKDPRNGETMFFNTDHVTYVIPSLDQTLIGVNDRQFLVKEKIEDVHKTLLWGQPPLTKGHVDLVDWYCGGGS